MADHALKLSETELARYRFMAESAAWMERDLWAASGVVAGAVVADVGCGPGAVSVVLAQVVGPAGQVLAVDREPDTVETARAVIARSGSDNVSVLVGEAHATGITPQSVDVAMIRHVLAHNRRLEEAIVADVVGRYQQFPSAWPPSPGRFIGPPLRDALSPDAIRITPYLVIVNES